MLVQCSKCGDPKDESEFGVRNDRTQTRQGVCLSCKSRRNRHLWSVSDSKLLSQRAYRKAHHRQQLQQSRDSYARRRLWMDSLKGCPCRDCGHKFPPCCMEWHHIDPQTKSFCVGSSVSLYSKERILAEIDKCDLLCANCHRIRTHQRKASRVKAVAA